MSLYPPATTPDALRLRPATFEDADLLASWDREPHVIACSTDDPEAEVAFGGIDWREELAEQSGISFYRIAEIDGRAIGVMQIIDPHLEPTHYWGDIEPGLRAIDIWIGPKDALGRGHGTEMMRQALDACFADPQVHGVVIDPLASNADAHRFYQRLGFRPEGRRMFGDDDCLVHRLTRADWEARAR
ncbi:GNAT family N-acetyltransferase [Brevundimonas viscosa]|uniref:Aminoglycoside 6'-N-acetyltransferase n=1 Tax=Brevundimonas viscosa TaxID=871741 RepID=A0A1I6NW49_9CAUL|nr:GNAT family N-acetyltransferase [Brevundimonas viscosa]SFS32161.1 aminoglycoside 6'-N-acetyltransferase [Brevundimonas viscosa]